MNEADRKALLARIAQHTSERGQDVDPAVWATRVGGLIMTIISNPERQTKDEILEVLEIVFAMMPGSTVASVEMAATMITAFKKEQA